jgi:DNA-binding beta-propeller fold protein YncE
VRNTRSAQLFEFTKDGRFVREIGKNLYALAWAHAVRVDKEDHIWLVDEAAGTVVKFDPQGHVNLVLGRRAEAVDGFPPASPAALGVVPPAQDGVFNRPTDIAWDGEGNSYISDGYANSRVAKYNKYGEWVKAWGEKGSGPGQFNLPHSIATDAKGNVYVADRNNNRIQVFDGDGKFLRQIGMNVLPPTPPNFRATIAAFGKKTDGTYNSLFPNTICISPGQFIYVSDMMPGRIYKMTLEGQVVGTVGIAGPKLGQLAWTHAIACPSDTEIYTGELLNWRVQRMSLRALTTN